MRLKTADIFADGMILQMEKPVSVWGTAEPGSRVVVRIQGRTAESAADETGRWRVILPALTASPSESMQIRSGEDEISIEDVAVGEVWLAGGQSNMEYMMSFDAELEKEKAEPEEPLIRMFSVPEISWEGEGERYDFSRFGFWRKCGGEDLEYFSAAAYYFARKLYKERQVPIGIVDCNYGGTRACCWMTEETIRHSGGQIWIREYEETLAGIDAEAEEKAYRADPKNAPTDPLGDRENRRVLYPGLSREEQEEMRRKGLPEGVIGRSHPWRPAGLFYTMLRTVIPYGIRGFLYYQGESDAPHADLYEGMLKGLIRLWRREWGEELPFLMVQLAPFESWLVERGENYPILREAQQRVADTEPGVWLASIGDAGMRWDIHPKRKRPVGERLALLALGHVYGENVKCDAPRPVSLTMREREAVLTFFDAEVLSVRGEKVNALEIRSDGKKLDDAKYRTQIDGNRLRILFENDPGSLRILFARTPWYEVNLYNEAGIPALPFEKS